MPCEWVRKGFPDSRNSGTQSLSGLSHGSRLPPHSERLRSGPARTRHRGEAEWCWTKLGGSWSRAAGSEAPRVSDPQEGRKFLRSPRALWQSWTPQASVPRGSVALHRSSVSHLGHCNHLVSPRLCSTVQVIWWPHITSQCWNPRC